MQKKQQPTIDIYLYIYIPYLSLSLSPYFFPVFSATGMIVYKIHSQNDSQNEKVKAQKTVGSEKS